MAKAARHSITAQKIVNRATVFSDFELAGAVFTGCALAQFEDPSYGRIVVRDASLSDIKLTNCSAHGICLERLTVDNLATNRATQLEACVFNRVTLKGRVGPIITTPANPSLSWDAKEAFASGAVAYYEKVDWALDITNAEFSDVDLYMVPGHLIKRDPETQFLLRRASFENTPIDQLDPIVQIFVDRFNATPFDSIVAVAPKRSAQFRNFLAALTDLRDAGLAE
ncbi:hypothetical protein [Kutzneria buriramensis]|uniref:Pentapeptide repeat protein n=1 Tax=Kutzneria buriramensis TaxID=1045776 RepID=A0A3E0HZI6_9PSEU|nr:hypothetical protein [Kutzneria buriramensis]REH51887.1 hypothetical protein BCF44_103336 [Kutzneria buriramensis]